MLEISNLKFEIQNTRIELVRFFVPDRIPQHYRRALAQAADVLHVESEETAMKRAHYYIPPPFSSKDVNLPDKIIQELSAAITPRWGSEKV